MNHLPRVPLPQVFKNLSVRHRYRQWINWCDAWPHPTMLGWRCVAWGQESWTQSCERGCQEVQDNEKPETYRNVHQSSRIKGNLLTLFSFTWGNIVYCSIFWFAACLADIKSSVTVVRWVSESMRPFHIVKDRGLHSLCKTGCPHFYLPDNSTVAKDVKMLYGWSECRLAKELQVSLSITHLQLDNWAKISSNRIKKACWLTKLIAGPHQTIVPSWTSWLHGFRMDNL